MKRLILLLSIILVGCNVNGDDPMKEDPEKQDNTVITNEDRTLYIVSFKEYIENEELEAYGVNAEMIDGDMENLKMKSIYLTDDEKSEFEKFEAVSFIEENGEVGIPEGPSEKNDDAK
ncbi:hypothetical protein [Phocicoccus pinnipedialis]|uniref:Uncharacterized protein n=1 Tax=Phocicoccus pinnipedialis TaxID=110845 RepID=A0A6V7RD61_9BACL|nr:hypothetical protein [Jeotgalicoccus pinnipedialis]MBP1939894.1 primase-polymerase (primpol)-like protein [Jeotgalicoccus pinnipedialis]CAD2074758.1 hypothetical protein JEOPIN946_00828 [Jeotgalicoccus pinnipedialis]